MPLLHPHGASAACVCVLSRSQVCALSRNQQAPTSCPPPLKIKGDASPVSGTWPVPHPSPECPPSSPPAASKKPFPALTSRSCFCPPGPRPPRLLLLSGCSHPAGCPAICAHLPGPAPAHAGSSRKAGRWEKPCSAGASPVCSEWIMSQTPALRTARRALPGGEAAFSGWLGV